MRRLHVLKSILVRTHADKILLTYLVFVVIAALIIQIVEPAVVLLRRYFNGGVWRYRRYDVFCKGGFGASDGLFDRGDRTSYRGDRQLL